MSLLIEAVLFGAMAARFNWIGDIKPKACSTLDGLRGVLAMLVFVSHIVTSYFYWGGEPWQYPNHRLFTYFGEAGVAVFFMITAFLFIGKLVNSEQISWKKLYVNRLFRIGPLYFIAASAVLYTALLVKGFRVDVSLSEMLISVIQLYSLGLFSVPEVNGNTQTWIFIAGTPWTLQYEWLFYLSLPLSWYLLKKFGSKSFIVLVCFLVVCLFAINTESGFIKKHISIFSYFAMGTLAVFMSRIAWLRQFASKRSGSWVILFTLAILYWNYPDVLGVPQALLLGIAFVLIVSGSDFFGLLQMNAMRLLGEISFSIYLLHGSVLYLVMMGLYRMVTQYGVTGYWVLSLTLVPLVIILSIITFRLVELPGQHIGRILIV